eukprot:3654340-Rhodomonas_salina.1
MIVRRLRLNTVPHFDRDGGCDPLLSVAVKSESDYEEYDLFRSRDHYETRHCKPSDRQVDLEIGSGGDGIRVAGDVHFVVTNVSQGFMGQNFGGKPGKVCHLWVHTCFMQQPPPDMAGTARQLSGDECSSERLPAGTWCLTMAKSEIDQAAQDSKNAKVGSAGSQALAAVGATQAQARPGQPEPAALDVCPGGAS